MKNRPKLNFDDMGIPNGAKLVSVETDETVKVSGHKRVVLHGETMSLSKATRTVLKIGRSIAPTPHWTFKGRLLKDIYQETYGEKSE